MLHNKRFSCQYSSLCIVFLVIMIFTFGGCGGGGGGGTGGVNPTPLLAVPIADTAASFWAAGTGSKWTYQLVDRRPGANQQTILKTVEDMGEVTVAGRVVRRFEHSWSLFDAAPEMEYRYFDGREIHSLVLPGTETSYVDYAEVPAPLHVNETTTGVDRTEQIDLNNDGMVDQVRIEVRTTLAIETSLRVPAGHFHRLLRSRQDLKITATAGGSGLSVSATAVLTTWYAPNIGVVRRIYEDQTQPGPNNTVTEELAGVIVGSTRAGMVPNIVALDGIGTGSGLDIAVGDSRIMTVYTSQAGTVEGAIHDSDGTLIWRGTVLTTSAPYLLQGAVAAFDGTDFRVVASRTIPYNSPTEYALIGQRVTAAGMLHDGPAGLMIDSGIPNASQTVASIKVAARQGCLLVSWGRYDTAYETIGPGLVRNRGYVIEGRLYDSQQRPVAARFELGSGLPGALAVRDDQYILVNNGQDGTVSTLSSWAIGIDGMPVSVLPQTLSSTSLSKGYSRLQAAGGVLWLSYCAWSGSVPSSSASMIVARLGRNGTLLDGASDVPGRTLTMADSTRSTGMLAIGASRSLLAWNENFTVRAVLFDNIVLSGMLAVPSTYIPLALGKPGASEPSRSIVTAADGGKALLVGWLENEQSTGAPSGRVMFTFIYPPYAAP